MNRRSGKRSACRRKTKAMRKTFLFLGSGILLIVALGAGLAYRGQRPPPSPLASPLPSLAASIMPSPETSPQEHQTPVPDLVFENYNGQAVRLHDFISKPIVINVWASWCPFCLKELPDLAIAQAELHNQVVIIAINRADPAAVAKRFTDGLGITNGLMFLLDPNDLFYKATGGFSMPETIFVDKKGFIQEHRRGPVEASEVNRKIQELLNE